MEKHAVVVGGGGAIGSAVARQFTDAGYSTIIGDIDVDEGLKVAEALPGKTHVVPVDVRCENSVASFAQRVGEISSQLLHVVSLAGGAARGEFKGLSAERKDASDSIALNLTSHMWLIQSLLPHISEGASIVVISSICAVRDFGLPFYSAAKAGLLGFVRACTTECGTRNVRINAVLPGTVPTPRTLRQPKDFRRRCEGTALGRLATPEEIGRVVYAVSEHMTCVTGQAIIADCGQAVRAPS